ncbi:PREDICTED: uncharacterized protein LOC109153450 [Ipomoea nil]|uniref:uncharacterized protein LOC109153450 n=1 Tax=Ipomoea nil TaxID=35883 RepID=UPI000900E249|nr:PREDICTED: uncharacterized protein LOC109153450 [Ipomoea nil]
MVRTRNQRQGKIPRRGTTSQFAGIGIPSNPVCIEEEVTTTIVMDPVPISQVPFEEVQNPRQGNLTVDLYGDLTISPSIEDELRENNVNPTQDEEEHPVVEPSPPPSLTPNIPPPRQIITKKQRGKNIEEEQDWIPDEIREDNECEEEGSGKKRKKLTAKEKGKQKIVRNSEKKTLPAKDNGKQKVVSDADLTKLPKPYSSKFLSKENAKDWNKFVDKNIINQKILILDKLENYAQISETLARNNLLGTVTNIYPYEEQVIREFYSNLTKATINPKTPMFGMVYLRGKFFEFNPEIINEYLGTSTGEQEIQLQNEQVAYELTAGNVSFDTNKIKVASLTSKYAILQKIVLVNWMPSLHETTFKWSLAELLYKIGKGIKVNLGVIIHSKITHFAENRETKAHLIFPNLVYSILTKQGLKSQGPKVQVKTLNTTIKLKKGAHQNDLKNSVPADDPTNQQTLIRYFEKKLRELDIAEKQLLRKHIEVKEEKAELLQWLTVLKANNDKEDSQQNEEATGNETNEEEEEDSTSNQDDQEAEEEPNQEDDEDSGSAADEGEEST